MTVRVDAQALETFARDLLAGMGAGSGTAQQVAESLVGSDLVGHTSHGVIRLPWYDEMVEADRLDPTATPAVESEDGATAAVDGRMAFGQVVGRTAVEVGVARAEEGGVAAVGVRNATHLGRIGEWAEHVTGAELVFLAFVNGQSGGSVAPPGTTDRRLFTNPVTFGVPTFDAADFPIVIDIATSQVANGKVKEYLTRGQSLPDGWAIAPDGEPQTDPAALLSGEGALLPLGGLVSGYKGFGLGIIAELLAASLGDGRVANQTDQPYSNAGAFVGIDPTAFTTKRRIADRVRALDEHVKSATPHAAVAVGPGAKGDDVLLPGEAEHRASREHREDGIAVSEADADLLRAFGDDRGVEPF